VALGGGDVAGAEVVACSGGADAVAGFCIDVALVHAFAAVGSVVDLGDVPVGDSGARDPVILAGSPAR
jgi:hypothetical protein